MKRDMRELLKELWKQACEYDDIEPEAKFVVFSDDNPYLPKYNKYLSMFLTGQRLLKSNQ